MLSTIQKGGSFFAVMDLTEQMKEIDHVSVMMINSNQDENIGVAPIRFEAMNGVNKSIHYDITGRVTLAEFITKKISQDTFRKMIGNLISVIENFEEYMLDIDQMLLDIDSVYINEVDDSALFICVPIKGLKNEHKLYDFFREIVDKSYVDWNVNEISYFNGVYNLLKNESSFSLQNLKMALGLVKSEASPKPFSAADSSNPVQVPPQNGQAVQQPVPEKKMVVEPDTITVQSRPVQYVPPQPVQLSKQQEEHSGLFGKLFGSSKKKEKKEKPATGYQGGLAGLKNGMPSKVADPKMNIQRPMTNIQQPMANAQQPMMNAGAQPVRAPQPMQANNTAFSGTTVLNASSPAKNQMPQQPVQNQVPQQFVQTQVPQQSVQTQVPQQPAQQMVGTTVLNSGAANNRQPSLVKQPVQQQAPPAQQQFVGTTALNPTQNMNNSPETTSLAGCNTATTVLKPAQSVRAFLVRQKTHENIELTKGIFLIGRDDPSQDYCINDNTAVGHKHARIVRKGDDFYLTDLESKNHTYLNGVLIIPNSEKKLNNGDKVRFANEEFEFRII